MFIETNQNGAHCHADDITYSSSTYTSASPVSLNQQVRRGVPLDAVPRDLLEPTVAAVDLIDDFKRLASALRPRDPSTQDDLVQVMCQAALECSNSNERSYYMWLAGWRAKDYLRWWTATLTRQDAEREPEIEDIHAA
ncbi:MAG: hypothetical protein WCT04_20080 [Planctomycetota bacterium]